MEEELYLIGGRSRRCIKDVSLGENNSFCFDMSAKEDLIFLSSSSFGRKFLCSLSFLPSSASLAIPLSLFAA